MFIAILSPKRIKIISALLAIAICFAGYKYYKSTIKPEVPPVEIYAVVVKKQDVPIVIKEIGSAMANQSVAIKSRIDSQIKEVLFRDGDQVLRDSVLIRLDERGLKASLTQLEANLSKDLTQLSFFEKEYARQLAIYSTGFQTQKDLDSAKNNFDSQKATVEITKAMVENAKILLDYTVIKAPISGRTGISKLTVGNVVKTNDSQPIVTINQIDPMLIQFAIAQKNYPQLKTVMQKGEITVSIEIPESKEILKGKLTSIDNTFDSNGNFGAQAQVPNKDERLWPGMYVNVTVDMGKEPNAITVPATSVQMGQDQQYVYIVEDNTAKRKPVKVKRTTTDIAIIDDGVSEGDIIITDGFLKIKNGSKVKVLEK